MSGSEVTRDDLRKAFVLGVQNGREITADLLKKNGYAEEKVQPVMRALFQQKLCALRKNKATGQVWLRVREEDIARKLTKVPAEEYRVYLVIEDSGTTGIWTQDIKKNLRGQLQPHVIDKACRRLHAEFQLIKQVKSIHHKNRKVYMLAHLSPSKEVAGGTFYEDGEFNETLVEGLRDYIKRRLLGEPRMTLQTLTNSVRTSGYGKELSDDDVKTIVRTLQLELDVQAGICPKTQDVVYTWAAWPAPNLLASLPCTSCDLIAECDSSCNASISPATCQYYDYWLSQRPWAGEKPADANEGDEDAQD